MCSVNILFLIRNEYSIINIFNMHVLYNREELINFILLTSISSFLIEDILFFYCQC